MFQQQNLSPTKPTHDEKETSSHCRNPVGLRFHHTSFRVDQVMLQFASHIHSPFPISLTILFTASVHSGLPYNLQAPVQHLCLNTIYRNGKYVQNRSLRSHRAPHCVHSYARHRHRPHNPQRGVTCPTKHWCCEY